MSVVVGTDVFLARGRQLVGLVILPLLATHALSLLARDKDSAHYWYADVVPHATIARRDRH